MSLDGLPGLRWAIEVICSLYAPLPESHAEQRPVTYHSALSSSEALPRWQLHAGH